jgi:LemA protein
MNHFPVAHSVPPFGAIFLLGILLVVLIWVIATYNSLVRLRQMIRESWSNVDTELRRRYDLIPNLVETVRGYAKHEREVLERVVQARAAAMASTGSPASQAADENRLIQNLRSLLGVVEAYPDLKASQNFLQLQRELTNTEDRIQAARRFFNGNVRDYNTKVLSFPSNLIAGAAGMKQEEFFEIEDLGVRQPVPVSFPR